MLEKNKHTAIVLAAGKGRRMEMQVPKQYLSLGGKPLLYYSLKAFEENDDIKHIILAVGKNEIDFNQENIIKKFSFSKISQVVEGGESRWESVYEALKKVKQRGTIWIHDSSRPFLTQEILKKCKEESERFAALTVAVPAKDTIKQVDENHMITKTLERKYLWQTQTPQVFSFYVLWQAYQKFLQEDDAIKSTITDDAMIVEKWTDLAVKIVMGDYHNIKITTKEDLETGETHLLRIKEKLGTICSN